MKKYFFVLLMLLAGTAWSQDSVARKIRIPADNSYQRNAYIVTLSVGFMNNYRSEYTVPVNFEKGNTTGFAPINGKFEYAASDKVSLALNASYSTIYFNSFQLFSGFAGPIRRLATNRYRILSVGLTAYYHLGHIIRVKRLDPFIGAGISLNNILQSHAPQGDSTVIKKQHTATPVLKAGARYYVSDKVSIFADAGYDKVSMFNVGFSCKFLPAKK